MEDIELKNFTNVIKSHVLYHYLSHSRHKSALFHTFNEYLGKLNTNALDTYYQQLNENNIHYYHFDKLKTYICNIKLKGNWLSNCLLNSL